MAPVSLASIQPTINWENTHKQNGYHAPLFSNYSSTSKCLLVRKCDIALEGYRMYAVYIGLACSIYIYWLSMVTDNSSTCYIALITSNLLEQGAKCHIRIVFEVSGHNQVSTQINTYDILIELLVGEPPLVSGESVTVIVTTRTLLTG